MFSVENSAASLSFTGERVIPGAVDVDLWNEHLARYSFAARFARHREVLDLGCGTGYGAELLAESAHSVIGLDSSFEAIAYASASCSKADFLAASAAEMPFRSGAFDLITAFELIEHLADSALLLSEAARVLSPDGVFLVSTPNKIAYADARTGSGPNPFHLHEFELDEFEQVLAKHFSFVKVLSQNHQAAVTFSGSATGATDAYLPSAAASSETHFFFAVCSQRPIAVPSFVFVPAAANLLQERESHIRALQSEIGELRQQFESLLHAHRNLNEELESHNHWALSLDSKLAQTRTQLQNKNRELADALAERNQAQASLGKAEAELRASYEASRASLDRVQAELAEAEAARHAFEVRLQAAQLHNDNMVAESDRVRSSSWVRLGRMLRVGPYSNRRLRLSPFKAFIRKRSEPLRQFVTDLFFFLAALPVAMASALALLAVDLSFLGFGKRRPPVHSPARHQTASIIIPNWNGRELLARSLPQLIAAVDLSSGNEIIVVDNASTDGSAAFLQEHFPQIRIHQLPQNAGFAGGANSGVAVAANEIVVLLNNDMHVQTGFLSPLLQHFADPLVFAVSSQIFFSDPQRRREETGLTETWWEKGTLRVGHRIDVELKEAYPCAYPGGGSSAFDKRKFLELGGFDPLFHPFYYEDTDLGRLAWKRGWKVFYEPSSVVIHEHRGTIGKNFSGALIARVVRRNAVLYCWKNIQDWRLLLSHFWAAIHGNWKGSGARSSADAYPTTDLMRACKRLPQICRSRWRARSLKVVSDREAFLRPQGGYFRDRFLVPTSAVPDRLSVLFVSPYPIEPPVHGGAVFMKETLTPLTRIADVHLLSFLDTPEQLAPNWTLSPLCQTAQFLVRPHFPIDAFWTMTPAAIREFAVREFDWLIQRSIYLQKIDVLQLEYTILGQYSGDYRNIPTVLFEHDISFQSLRRRLASGRFRCALFSEYVRMRVYEPRLLKRFNRVQVCSEENAEDLVRAVPALRGRVDADVRAAIDIGRYSSGPSERLPDTLLFVGSFRHSPNLDALRWFTEEVFPAIILSRPSVTLQVVGSDPPASSTIWNDHPQIRLLGTVPDIKEPLRRFSVFICPVLSGSGVRVKLLEAFACGIPAVSTILGAEGLAKQSGEFCELADEPAAFADAVLRLLIDPDHGAALASRARAMVEQKRDSREATCRLEAIYRTEVQKTRQLEPFRSKVRSRPASTQGSSDPVESAL